MNINFAALKTARKQSREEEIASHGKPINHTRVAVSKKVYNRKREKAVGAEEIPPCFFISCD